MAAVASLRPKHFKPVIGLECGLTDPTCGLIMGKTAEILAQEFGITRGEQDTLRCDRTSAPPMPRNDWRRRSRQFTPAGSSTR